MRSRREPPSRPSFRKPADRRVVHRPRPFRRSQAGQTRTPAMRPPRSMTPVSFARKQSSMIGRSIGNYRIEAKLGEGGMGAVYLGAHPLIGKKVAIKVLLHDSVGGEELAARFFNEARVVNDVGHPNIVDIVDVG